jgi:hypothetical protein
MEYRDWLPHYSELGMRWRNEPRCAHENREHDDYDFSFAFLFLGQDDAQRSSAICRGEVLAWLQYYVIKKYLLCGGYCL